MICLGMFGWLLVSRCLTSEADGHPPETSPQKKHISPAVYQHSETRRYPFSHKSGPYNRNIMNWPPRLKSA